MCRSRRELSNAYLLAKIGFDTAENEPLEVWGENSIQYSLHSLGTIRKNQSTVDQFFSRKQRCQLKTEKYCGVPNEDVCAKQKLLRNGVHRHWLCPKAIYRSTLRSEVNSELNFPPKLRGARSRLYRRRFLQVNTRWKALAEIYTMHSFAPFFNLKISAKNRHHFFAIGY